MKHKLNRLLGEINKRMQFFTHLQNKLAFTGLFLKSLFLRDKVVHEIDIQPTDRFVFVHIAKTAGTTFNAILEPVMCGLPYYPEYLLEKLISTELEDLRKYHFFSGHFPYELFERIFQEGFIGLTFLREPVSRTISNLKFVHQLLKKEDVPELSDYANEFEQAKKMTLMELLESKLKLTLHFTNIQTRFMGSLATYEGSMRRDMQQTFAGFGDPSQLAAKIDVEPTQVNLDIAKLRLVDTAFFGITERFQDSLFLLSYIFGWRPTLNKMHLNATSEGGDKINISSQFITSIQEKVSVDLELYEFGQSLFERRFNEMTQTLLLRYGRKEHAALKWPLPAEVMMELLEQHFVKRRDNRFRHAAASLSDTYEYFPSMYVEGSFGWHSLENSPRYGPIRWSGPGLQSGFDLPCPPGKNIQISFSILMAPQPEIMEQLSLTANNMLVTLMREFRPNGSYVFTGEIPPQAIAGPFIQLVFSIPKTIAPCSIDPNNEDDRLVGVLLNWVKLVSVSDDDPYRRAAGISGKIYQYFSSADVESPFGWHLPENSPIYGPMHWSGPGLQSGFSLPCPFGENIQVSFCILRAIQPDIMDGLSLTANHVPIDLMCEYRSDGTYVFTGEIPHQAIDGSFIRLVFSIPKTVVPRSIDPNSDDTRLLGVLLNWVKLGNKLRLDTSETKIKPNTFP